MYTNRRTSASALPSRPPGAQRSAVSPPSSGQHAFPASESGYTFEITPPVSNNQVPLLNSWETPSQRHNEPPKPPPKPPRPRIQSMQHPPPPRFNGYGMGTGASASSVSYGSQVDLGGVQRYPFPEPTFYRSTSFRNEVPDLPPPPPPRPSLAPSSAGRLTHHRSTSDFSSPSGTSSPPTLRVPQYHQNPSVVSFASSYNGHSDDDHGYYETPNYEADRSLNVLSDAQLASEEGLRRFQAGELTEKDEEWHRLVPPEARDALGKKEVQRQSVIFEVIKSERDYVADLEAVETVFIEGLRTAKPPIIPGSRLAPFLDEVFMNLHQILSFHQRILAALFVRQRDQHPLVQSIADIILDTALKSEFRSEYETYIKHYPLAESRHRKTLKSNRAYEAFIHSVSNDPRIRKRDLITFLSRPVTKLPRLNLLLEQILKLTDPEHEHPDLETLPIILGVLKDCIKSTQPGIEAAESKVKFWALCESLVFQKGEIIDMDLYDDSRTLVYIGPVMRRSRSDTGFTEKWTELTAALLDNYFLLIREEKRPNGIKRNVLTSRPMPLSFLRLGAFNGLPETRREKNEEGGLLDSFRGQSVPMYPFTIYHAFLRSSRRYTLYVASDALRKKWYNSFVDTIGVHKVRQDANMWFNPQTLTDGFFRTVPQDSAPTNGLKITGRIQCAVPFFNGSRRFLAIGCGPGIYAGPVNSEKFRKVLSHRNATSLAAFGTSGEKVFNRLVVHVDSSVISYSLDLMARLALGQTGSQTLEASSERIGANDTNIAFCKHINFRGKDLLIYLSKRRLGTSLNLHVLEAVDLNDLPMSPRSPVAPSMRSFKPYGEASPPAYIPKDANDVVTLSKSIGICTSDGIVTMDPTNLAQSQVVSVPELKDASNNEFMSLLKSRLEGQKPLGIVRVDANELLVVYDEMGCYIDKHGLPARHCGFIKWEIKAVSYSNRNGQILLVSPEFIEVRSIATGRIVQVIEGQDIRLLYSGPYTSKDDPILVAMRGGKKDKEGVSERIAELIQTEEISITSPTSATPLTHSIWDKWDM